MSKVISHRLILVIGLLSHLTGVGILRAQTPIAAPSTITRSEEADGVVRWESHSIVESHRPRFFDVFSSLTSLPLPDDPEQLPFGRSVAFIVGVSRYTNLDPLPGVEQTVHQLREYLLHDGGFDIVYELTDFEVIPNLRVRPSLVRDYMLNRFVTQLRRSDRLLFYFAGHGTDRNATTGYLLFRNASKRSFDDNYLSTNDIREWSQAIPARHILFLLDACSAGFGFGLAPQGGDLGVLAALGESRSREIITAGIGKQETFDVLESNGSHITVFGAALLSALTRSTASEDFRSLITTDRLFNDLSAKELAFANQYSVPLKPGRYPLLTDGQFVFPNPLAKGFQSPAYLADALHASEGPSSRALPIGKIIPGRPGSIPPIVTGGARIGTSFQYTYMKGNSLECTNEYVKVSATEWFERPLSQSPAGCMVDAVIFKYTERESIDPQYYLLYDEGRNLLARLSNTKPGDLSPTEWRLVSSQAWNVVHSVRRMDAPRTEIAVDSGRIDTPAHTDTVVGAGNIEGTITDPNQNPIPDAELTLLNPSTGWSKKGQTNHVGAYRFDAVPTGTYSMLVKAQGYQEFTKTINVRSTSESGISRELELTPVSRKAFGWAVGSNGTILNTKDNGASWTKLDVRIDKNLKSVFFVTQQLGWAVGAKGLIVHTENGGLTWTPQTSGVDQNLTSVCFTSPREGWATGVDGALLHTKDGGNTWALHESFGPQTLAQVTFSSPESGWLVTNYRVYQTENGGTKWIESKGLRWKFDSGLWVQSLLFVTPRIGIAVGMDSHDASPAIKRTEDGGRTWKTQCCSIEGKDGPKGSLLSLAFPSTQLGWAVGFQGVILNTRDGGLSWQRQDSHITSQFTSVTFVDSQSGWAVGVGGVIVYTHDGGASWNQQVVENTPLIQSTVSYSLH